MPRRVIAAVALATFYIVVPALIAATAPAGTGVAQDGVASERAPLPQLIAEGQPAPNQAALDLTFNPGSFTNGQVNAALLEPDGKLIIAGLFNKVHGVARHGIARLNADGTLDQSFNAGDAAAGSDNGRPSAIMERGLIRQPDGKLIVSGGFRTFNGVPRNGVARLNPDGSLDMAFNPGRGLSYSQMEDGNGNPVSRGDVYAVVLQADGKVILFGTFRYVITAPGASVERTGLARFDADGNFDPAFAQSSGFFAGVAFASALGAAQRGDGKIYVFGDFDRYGADAVPGLARLNVDGTLDPSFAPPASGISPAGIFAQQDGRLLVFGYFNTFAGAPSGGIVRLLESGAVDGGFDAGILNTHSQYPSVRAVAQQPDGQLLVAGDFHSRNGEVANNIVRLGPGGERDPNFSGAGTGASGFNIVALVVRPGDGKIFAGGYFSSFAGVRRNNIAWLTTDGLPDGTFAGLEGATDYAPQIYAIVRQPDGKILVGGFFSSFNGASHYNLVRLSENGSIDPTFDPTLGTDGSVRTILLTSDGKIIIAGAIRAVNGVPRSGIARLHSDGTLDASFNVGTGSDAIITTIAEDFQGNLFVGGTFSVLGGTPRLRIAKLGSTGAVDAAFDPGTGFNGTVSAIVPDGPSDILVGGTFTRYQGATVNRIARLSTTTAQRSSTLGSPGANGAVRVIKRTIDGKFYAAGAFTTFNGASRSKIARVQSDGLLDSFVSPTLDIDIYALGLSGTRVVLGGSGPVGSPRLARLTDAGNFDPDFQPGSGIGWAPANAYTSLIGPIINTIAVDSGGRTLIGGTYNHYNGEARVGLARLTSSALDFTAVSRKMHGNEGPFDIPLPFAGSPGVECRTGGTGGNYQVVFNFGGTVTFMGASVTSGSGAVTNVSGNGSNTVTIDLSGVTSGQRITITLSSVNGGGVNTDVAVPMSVLVGDTTGNGSVTTSDIGQVKGQSGQLLTSANFRADVTANGGSINASDIGIVKSQSGTQLP